LCIVFFQMMGKNRDLGFLFDCNRGKETPDLRTYAWKALF
jgi:hypothetical protein